MLVLNLGHTGLPLLQSDSSVLVRKLKLGRQVEIFAAVHNFIFMCSWLALS